MDILIFILVLGLLIFVHELGHFLAAKLTGMKVEEFSIGFKPAIIQKKIGETNYILGLIPIGGYVKILGENTNIDEVKLDELDKKRTFSSRSKTAQIMVLSMGVIFNILFAWMLFSTSLFFGTESISGTFPDKFSKDKGVKILSVKEKYPAFISGLKSGDKILSVNSKTTSLKDVSVKKYQDFLRENYKDLTFIVQRGQNRENLKINIKKLKKVDGGYVAGIYIIDTVQVEMPFLQSIIYGFQTTFNKIYQVSNGVFGFFKDVFIISADINNVSGPIGIVKYVGDAAQNGFSSLIIFVAMLSLNLAVINFLPFPALDGGRVLFILIEFVTRRKIPELFFNWTNGVGFIFLIGLMVIITFNDIWKLFN